MSGGFSVDLLRMGRGEVPGPEVFWMGRFDEWLPLDFQTVLIRGDGVTALINTGPAHDLVPMNDRWADFLGERARFRRSEGEFILDQLRRHGVAPDQITHVILTPLQLYTVSNVLAFPKAQICISRRGWVHFHTTHEHPHDDRATSIPDEILIALVTTAWPRIRLLDPEDVVVPGIRTWDSGGHHRASLVVEIDTPAGTVAVSDTYFYLDNVTTMTPIGISENMDECLRTYERVRRDADVVVPLYDPLNFDRFPDGRIASVERSRA
ncbi:hypothetical protein [Tsukamurella tyrosinosolvens]|uniref:hypothetical protein n=1 Tax=Tsukamurella tyrosinosolvens TaxID=57704 RepID=UPI001C6A7E45|nr:hypothetical protein [Tsukamurella tyrosinosolvens]